MIVTSHRHHAIVVSQLEEIGAGDARIVLEPEGRDTAPAIVIAALLARATLRKGQEGYLLVLPSDHVLKRPSSFHMGVRAILDAPGSAERLWAIGVPAQRPEPGYGYLRLGASAGKSLYEVESFVEKPCRSRACEFISNGKYVWNSGMFLFPVALLLEEIGIHFPEILSSCCRSAQEADFEHGLVRLDESSWHLLTSISIDQALMERTSCAGAVLTDPEWSDLGSWRAWWDVSSKDYDANVVVGPVAAHHCRNAMIKSDGPVIAALGVSDVAIVASGNSVLVAALDRAGELKELVSKADCLSPGELKTPSNEERPWGRFDGLVKGDGYQVKIITVNPGGTLSLQYHHHRSEHWTVVQGTADVRVGDRKRQLKPNDSVYIPCGEIHRLANSGEETVLLIEVQVGEYLGEDDIVRLEDQYGRNSPLEGGHNLESLAQMEIDFAQH